MSLSKDEIKQLQAHVQSHKNYGDPPDYQHDYTKDEIWEMVPHGILWRQSNRNYVTLHLPDHRGGMVQFCAESRDDPRKMKKVTRDIEPVTYSWCKKCIHHMEKHNEFEQRRD